MQRLNQAAIMREYLKLSTTTRFLPPSIHTASNHPISLPLGSLPPPPAYTADPNPYTAGEEDDHEENDEDSWSSEDSDEHDGGWDESEDDADNEARHRAASSPRHILPTLTISTPIKIFGHGNMISTTAISKAVTAAVLTPHLSAARARSEGAVGLGRAHCLSQPCFHRQPAEHALTPSNIHVTADITVVGCRNVVTGGPVGHGVTRPMSGTTTTTKDRSPSTNDKTADVPEGKGDGITRKRRANSDPPTGARNVKLRAT